MFFIQHHYHPYEKGEHLNVYTQKEGEKYVMMEAELGILNNQLRSLKLANKPPDAGERAVSCLKATRGAWFC